MDVFAKTNGISDKCIMKVSDVCMCYSNGGDLRSQADSMYLCKGQHTVVHRLIESV